VMAGFLQHRLTEVLDYVKKNADYSVERRDDGLQRQLLITGVFFTQSFATTVETELNMRSATVSACCPPISPHSVTRVLVFLSKSGQYNEKSAA